MKPIYYTYIGEREKNEDRYFIKINKKLNYELYCVLDGHNGPYVSEYCSKYILKNLERILPKIDFSIDLIDLDKLIKETFEYVFLKCQISLITNKDMLKYQKSGTTICCILIKDNNAWVANCGDSRLVLSNLDFSNEEVTQDHNSKNIFERARVIVQGGWYENRYLFGKINTTRGIGDIWQLKKIRTDNLLKLPKVENWSNFGLDSFESIKKFFELNNLNWFISPIPQVYAIRDIKKYLFMFLATDGVWSVINSESINNEISNLIMHNDCIDTDTLKLNIFRKIINNWDKSKKNSDNITFICKFFHDIFRIKNKENKENKQDNLEDNLEQDNIEQDNLEDNIEQDNLEQDNIEHDNLEDNLEQDNNNNFDRQNDNLDGQDIDSHDKDIDYNNDESV